MQTLGDKFPKKHCKVCGKEIEARFDYCLAHKDEGRKTGGGPRGPFPVGSGRLGERSGGRPGGRSSGGQARGHAGGNRSNSVYPEPGITFEEYLEALRKDGYFTTGVPQVIREELLTEQARAVALRLVESNISTSQLRRFFNQARDLEQKLADHRAFAIITGALARLPAQAANLVGRESSGSQRERLEDLHSFIVINTDKARASETAFKHGFLPHFECVLAYFTYYKTTRKR